MRPSIAAVLSVLSTLQFTNAQTANGVIVPFSTLPACAALCGPLFDVQGKCSPPASATVDDSCFCSDSRLTPFTTGTAGVSQVCGSASCSATSDLQAIETWYTSFCASNNAVTAATTTASSTGSTATSTSTSNTNGSSSSSSSSANKSWLSTHYKWVIMLVVMFVVIVGTWVAACLFRRRYLRRKEKEIEMLPPVALGPHQLQAMTGGYRYGDGVLDANRGGHAGGHHKEMAAAEATAANGAKRQSRGLTKKRDRLS
ncbi:uncharacterized protein LY89DRAFT_307774 [Mollisia scopiformis]|uniref:CFEM domain-containing protein n=1 Tax=Mollisia scopiformis TaxID=149040 RepID=A0A194XR76_MOLSC|nr:uncharacterized protein LY89DRAFT_307774 [Mollisia scopiformis]KUJ22693.1 hypothetical protein LY89DRAFT_307774 [Mollisia scopiformis]